MLSRYSLFSCNMRKAHTQYGTLRGLQGYSEADVFTSVKQENKIEVSNAEIEKIYVGIVDENGLQIKQRMHCTYFPCIIYRFAESPAGQV